MKKNLGINVPKIPRIKEKTANFQEKPSKFICQHQNHKICDLKDKSGKNVVKINLNDNFSI